MKIIYSLLFVITFYSAAFSQALPNQSFDNWTNAGSYDDPDNWSTLNAATSGFGAITAQKATGNDVHTGAAAIKLVTLFVLIQNANGIATTGTINVGNQTIDGGIPYTLRPDSLTGWYKCDPQGADYGFVDFSLLNAAGTDTVGFAHFQTPNAAINTYTYFSVPVVYYNANTPALSRCVMSSSAGFTSVLNSVLIVDDVDLVFNPDGIREPVFGNANVLYKATSGKLIVNSSKRASLSVIDMSGKMVFNNMVNEGTSEFTLTDLTEGIYAFILTDDAASNISSGKFIIQ
ncbi:MAG: T9SS type A sorting domain-containing protein [Bacteroidetes bacterium]|nr:T9SS type A sorting domain-containing protein [Bacteroidota bacterium]